MFTATKKSQKSVWLLPLNWMPQLHKFNWTNYGLNSDNAELFNSLQVNNISIKNSKIAFYWKLVHHLVQKTFILIEKQNNKLKIVLWTQAPNLI